MSDKFFRAEAEHVASQVVKDGGFTSLPVCPFIIAKNHDIDVAPKESNKPGVSGFLLRVGNTFGIRYAQHIQNDGFKRFTVANELGHYFLPGHPEKLFPNGDGVHESKSGFVSSDNLERQADSFASALLMPDIFFRKAVDDAGSGLAAIEKLAKLCITSITSTAIRYTHFTDDAVAVIVSSGQRIEYCFMSERIREIDGICWIKKGDPLPKGHTSDFNSDLSNIEDARRAEGACFLDDWFDEAPHVEVNEDVIGLGSYGKSLTVLFTDEAIEDGDEDEDD
jgi:hypothetical protein